MIQSIWGSTQRTPSTTMRIPVDMSSSSSPGHVTGLDIVDFILTPQTGNNGKFVTTDGSSVSWTFITESKLTISDTTTNDASTTKHGFLPKLSGDADTVLDGNGVYSRIIECIGISPSDETTDLITGTSKVTFRAPYDFTITDIKASLTSAATGSSLIADVNVNGSSILSTKLSIDAGEKTSKTAAVPPVLSSTTLTDDDEISVDIDQVGSTFGGRGLKIYILGYRNA